MTQGTTCSCGCATFEILELNPPNFGKGALVVRCHRCGQAAILVVGGQLAAVYLAGHESSPPPFMAERN